MRWRARISHHRSLTINKAKYSANKLLETKIRTLRSPSPYQHHHLTFNLSENPFFVLRNPATSRLLHPSYRIYWDEKWLFGFTGRKFRLHWNKVDDLSILCGMFLFLPIVKGWAWLYDAIINHLYINIWIIIYQTSSRKGEVWSHYLLAAALVIGV